MTDFKLKQPKYAAIVDEGQHSHNRTPCEWITIISNNKDDSHKSNAEWRESDSKSIHCMLPLTSKSRRARGIHSALGQSQWWLESWGGGGTGTRKETREASGVLMSLSRARWGYTGVFILGESQAAHLWFVLFSVWMLHFSKWVEGKKKRTKWLQTRAKQSKLCLPRWSSKSFTTVSVVLTSYSPNGDLTKGQVSVLM